MIGNVEDDPVTAIDPDVVREPLMRLFEELDASVAEHGPVCELSGRCCRFAEYGHVLFLSAAEAALLVADAPPPGRSPDDGETCPWQDPAGRCGARAARPLGCRVYFCDPNYQGHAEPLTETFLGRLKGLVESLGLPWGYARLHHHLHAASAAGLLRVEAAGDDATSGASDRHDPAPGQELLDISLSDQ